jgi:tRNA(Ile)-lysidine synthetase-like protein
MNGEEKNNTTFSTAKEETPSQTLAPPAVALLWHGKKGEGLSHPFPLGEGQGERSNNESSASRSSRSSRLNTSLTAKDAKDAKNTLENNDSNNNESSASRSSRSSRLNAFCLPSHRSLLTAHCSLLVACSGGLDSIALLYMYAEMKKETDFRLGACYVNHKLRPEAVDERNFVDKICQELGVEFYGAEFADDFWGKSQSNFEEKGRIERYRILEEVAFNNNFEFIATAHHLDDQIETLLMRIFERGTGPKGLCGIKPTRKLGRVTLIRPLLETPLSELREYMKNREHIKDQSNSDTTIRRNYYRHIVIPEIEKLLGPDFRKHISTLSKNAQRETEFTKEMAHQFWQSLKTHENQTKYLIPRQTIEKYSDNFWFTAFSYFFSETWRHGDNETWRHGDMSLKVFQSQSPSKASHSPSVKTLKDIVAFIKKRDPATANYNPFDFERDREGILIRLGDNETWRQ